MKATITLLILTAVMFAQAPGNWGPGGIPTDWRGSGIEFMEASKFVSAAGTNISMRMASGATADSVVWTRTGTAGHYDFFIKYIDESGVARPLMQWRDQYSQLVFPVDANRDILFGKVGTTGQRLIVGNELYFDSSNGSSWSIVVTSVNDILCDPDLGSSGTFKLGDTGDADIFWLNSLTRLQGTVAADTLTMGLVEQIWVDQTAADTLRCPASPTAGDLFMPAFSNASGGVLDGNGKNINGAADIVANQYDSFILIYTGTEWRIY